MSTVLAIDLGTSQVKALLFDPELFDPERGAADGMVLGQGTASYPVATPREGWAESDPGLWWRAVRSAVAAAGPADVAAIGVTGQMHGVVLCDERTVVLRPAILWLDRRAGSEVKRYGRLTQAQLAALGSAPWPGAAGPMLLWLSRHEPAVYRAARWQLQPKDWLRMRLTGEAAADPTDASGTLMYDLRRDTWAFGAVDALGLRTDLLPPIRGSAEVAGGLLDGPAAELGLAPGIPVVVGCADTAASLLAARVAGVDHPVEPGSGWALLTLGTGGQWIAPVDAADPADPDPAGHTYLLRAVDGRYRLAGTQNVGVALDWVRRMLGVSWDDLYAAASRPPAPGLAFEPWLVSERGRSGGGWTGVALSHGRDDLLRAALDGVAGLLRDRLDDLRAAAAGPGQSNTAAGGPGQSDAAAGGPGQSNTAGSAPRRVLIGGGGGGHPAWRALLAETLGLPLYPATTPSLTARGAALLAARALA